MKILITNICFRTFDKNNIETETLNSPTINLSASHTTKKNKPKMVTAAQVRYEVDYEMGDVFYNRSNLQASLTDKETKKIQEICKAAARREAASLLDVVKEL